MPPLRRSLIANYVQRNWIYLQTTTLRLLLLLKSYPSIHTSVQNYIIGFAHTYTRLRVNAMRNRKIKIHTLVVGVPAKIARWKLTVNLKRRFFCSNFYVFLCNSGNIFFLFFFYDTKFFVRSYHTSSLGTLDLSLLSKYRLRFITRHENVGIFALIKL